VDVEVDEAGQDRCVAEVDRPARFGVEVADRDDFRAANQDGSLSEHARAVEDAVGGEK
jgi:hypothetical protein